MSSTDETSAADRGSELTEGLGPLPEPAVHWREDMPLLNGGNVMAAIYYRPEDMRAYAAAEVARAVAAERERWERIRVLADQCAEWHIGDGDECGEIARELLALLRA